MLSNANRRRIGSLDRLKTGWTLTKDSLGVIRNHPQLLAFPLLAGVAVAVAVAAPVASLFAGPGLFLSVVLVGRAVVFTYLLGQAIRGIAKTALHVYAVEGVAPEEFGNFDFETLVGRTERPAAPGMAGVSSTVTDGR